MRSVFMVGCSVFVLVSAAAYGISWVAQGLAASRSVEHRIEAFNTPTRALLAYESLSMSGFPSALTISIEKPRLQQTIADGALQALFSSPIERVTLTVNRASNRLDIAVLTATESNHCSIHAEDSGWFDNFWEMARFTEPKASARAAMTIDCDASNRYGAAQWQQWLRGVMDQRAP